MTSGWNTTDYCSVAEVRTLLRITDSVDDSVIQNCVTAASRAVDQECNRQFGITGSAIARVYTYIGQHIERRSCLEIDDLQDLTTGPAAYAFDLSYTGTYLTPVVQGTDFDLWPWNAAANGRPYTHMVMRPISRAYFPRFTRGIQITANFGWTAVPTVVKQATIIQAGRFFVRRDSLYGVAGSPQLGNEIRLLERLDPDVALMLRTVKRDYSAS